MCSADVWASLIQHPCRSSVTWSSCDHGHKHFSVLSHRRGTKSACKRCVSSHKTTRLVWKVLHESHAADPIMISSVWSGVIMLLTWWGWWWCCVFLSSSGTSDPYCIVKVDNEVVARWVSHSYLCVYLRL